MFDDALLLATLRERFGHSGFRPGQLEVLRALGAGKPTLAVMPTGSGKSLCYQLPSLLLAGVTLVVSPLVALMKDQVDKLRERGIAAAFVNSSQTEAERLDAEGRLARGELRLVFVAPERFRSRSFREALGRARLALVAVDEAHCVSEWGHSFRPDYALLGELVESLAPPHRLALTATATPDVRADILRALRFRPAHVQVAGFDRPNLHLEVQPLSTEPEKRDTLLAAVRAHAPAIAYSATRRQADAMTKHLVQHGVRAAAYHGGLETDVRTQVQDAFAAGRLDAVVATNAFGLGVDKADVRLVVHTELPRSLEAYYQEIGRAGRDGKPAIGALFFAPKDIFLQRALMRLSSPRPQSVEALWTAIVSADGPLSREELKRRIRRHGAEVFASLAFLEGIGAIDRRPHAATRRLELLGKVDADGESAPAALHRLLGGRRGEVSDATLAAALGCPTPLALEEELRRLQAEGRLVQRRTRAEVGYARRPGGELTGEGLQRLRIRLGRDQARFGQMISLAQGSECRRRALLRALGERFRPGPCDACDVCAGRRLAQVRSQLPFARAPARVDGPTGGLLA